MYYLCIRLQINISVLFCSRGGGGVGGLGVLMMRASIFVSRF